MRYGDIICSEIILIFRQSALHTLRYQQNPRLTKTPRNKNTFHRIDKVLPSVQIFKYFLWCCKMLSVFFSTLAWIRMTEGRKEASLRAAIAYKQIPTYFPPCYHLPPTAEAHLKGRLLVLASIKLCLKALLYYLKKWTTPKPLKKLWHQSPSCQGKAICAQSWMFHT